LIEHNNRQRAQRWSTCVKLKPIASGLLYGGGGAVSDLGNLPIRPVHQKRQIGGGWLLGRGRARRSRGRERTGLGQPERDNVVRIGIEPESARIELAAHLRRGHAPAPQSRPTGTVEADENNAELARRSSRTLDIDGEGSIDVGGKFGRQRGATAPESVA